LRQAFRDPRVETCKIGPHRVRLEGDGQHAPVNAVLVEIEQHQPAGKQLVEDDAPPERGRELLLRIKEHQLVGFGSEHGDVGMAKRAATVNHAVALHAPLDEPPVVGDDRQRVADERPAVVAGNVRKQSASRTCGAIGPSSPRLKSVYRHGAFSGGELLRHRHTFCVLRISHSDVFRIAVYHFAHSSAQNRPKALGQTRL
jgi:hypothetical protein